MLSYPIATALLLLGQGGSSAAAAAAKKKGAASPHAMPFMRKMDGHKKHARRRLSVKEFQAELHGNSKKSAALRKKIIEKSTVIKPPGGGRKLEDANDQADDQADNANDQADADNADDQADNQANAENAYGNGYNANAKYNTYNNAYGNNYNYQNNNANNADNPYNNGGRYVYNEDGTVKYKYNADRDGADDYFQAFGEWENSFGFDPTQFSLSYHRCAAVRQFDDIIAASEDTDSVFATKVFAVFRFCPARTCMGWEEEEEEEWECDEDTYGEAYCEALEEYMEVMEENAQMYRQYGNGWNGWNQNGGYDQANNWMNVNAGNYQGSGYNNNGQQVQQYGQSSCVCEDGAEEGKDANGNACECDNGRYWDGSYQGEDEEEQRGARGDGCQNNYGEYLIEMEEYLEVMLEWQEERFEQYCEYCELCMYDVYQAWLQNGGQHRHGRKLGFEEFKNTVTAEELENLKNAAEAERILSSNNRKLGNNYYKVCPEYDTCSEYKKTCEKGFQDDFSGYWECTEVESSGGQTAYLGPHCSEDGFTMTVGVYADQYCNEYIGNGVDVSQFLGFEIDEEEDIFRSYYNSAYGSTLEQLKYVNEENVCIPCASSELMWMDRKYNNCGDDDQTNCGDDDGYANKGNEINELCESVYKVSARCDKHFRAYNSKSKQAKYAEAAAQEDLTCDFIDSIVMGNYNEMGEIDMGNRNGESGADGEQVAGQQPAWMAKNMYAQQYGQYITEVTPLQIFGLIASILAVCILGAWSMTLRSSLTKSGPWRPTRGMRSPALSPATAAALDRQNSGIVIGRSESNRSTSYYMS